MFAVRRARRFVGLDHWQSLRLNMPATSIRDLAVKDDTLPEADVAPTSQLVAAVQAAQCGLHVRHRRRPAADAYSKDD